MPKPPRMHGKNPQTTPMETNNNDGVSFKLIKAKTWCDILNNAISTASYIETQVIIKLNILLEEHIQHLECCNNPTNPDHHKTHFKPIPANLTAYPSFLQQIQTTLT